MKSPLGLENLGPAISAAGPFFLNKAGMRGARTASKVYYTGSNPMRRVRFLPTSCLRRRSVPEQTGKARLSLGQGRGAPGFGVPIQVGRLDCRPQAVRAGNRPIGAAPAVSGLPRAFPEGSVSARTWSRCPKWAPLRRWIVQDL